MRSFLLGSSVCVIAVLVPVRTVSDVCDVLESDNLGDKLLVRGRYPNSAKDSGQVLHRWHARITLGQ